MALVTVESLDELKNLAGRELGPTDWFEVTQDRIDKFAEATGDMHTAALIELGLVLFLLTFILNGLARLLMLLTTQRGSGTAQA